MNTNTPKPEVKKFTQNKYFKPLVASLVVAILLFSALIVVLLASSNDDNETNNDSQTDTQTQTPPPPVSFVKSYPTDVCPEEIIYGQGLPKGIWNGVEHQVTDDEGIQWLDNVCKPQIQAQGSSNQTQNSNWQYVNDSWVYKNGSVNPPTCPDQLLQMSPVNVSKATSILYPGQTRGQYKPHGGFRFDGLRQDEISVTLPITARLIGGAKYTESGDTQYLLEFVSDCGIAIRFDHLLTLTGEFKTIGDNMPLNPPGDTRGQFLEGKEFAAGSLVATAVGIPSMNNTGVDFGVYDYRQRNQAAQDPNYVSGKAQYSPPQTLHALCWLDLLPNGDAAIAKALPGGDASAGKTSDYCK